MLILTRNIGESLIIGENVKVTILPNYQHENAVKIGINAPREVSVHREEIYNQAKEEKQA